MTILAIATAVIVISLIVQGLTLEPLVRRAGIARPADARHEQTVARLRLAEAARASLQVRIGHARARMLGSVSQHCVHQAHCPVVVIRRPKGESQPRR